MYEGLFAFLAIFGGFIFIMLLVVLAGYVLTSLGLMTMAKNKGIENPWLAWIPIGNMWILGQIIVTVDFGGNKYDNAGMILAVGCLASALLGAIPVIGQLISLAFLILSIMCLYKLYKMYSGDNAVMYLVLSIIFNAIAIGVILYKLKDVTPTAVE